MLEQDIPHLGTIIQADVAAVHSTHVVLDKATTLQVDHTLKGPGSHSSGDSDKLPYDVLAICTGSSYSNSVNKTGSNISLKDRKAGVQVRQGPAPV